MGLRSRLDRARRATQDERNMEQLKALFQSCMQDLRAQVAGAPREGAATHHRIVENTGEPGGRIEKDTVEDLSEP